MSSERDIHNLSRELNDKSKVRELGINLNVKISDIGRFFEKYGTETSEAAFHILMCWFTTNENKKEAYKILHKEFKKAGLSMVFSEQVKP